MDIKTDVETGSSLQQAFLKFPLYFNALYCNLIGAGEAAGILDALLERLATYMEKTEALKSKIKGALTYPISIIAIAFIITAVIMIFVIPAFKELFEGFGAKLPTPTVVLMNISDIFVLIGILFSAWLAEACTLSFISGSAAKKSRMQWTGRC